MDLKGNHKQLNLVITPQLRCPAACKHLLTDNLMNSNPTIYVASKTKHASMWRLLRGSLKINIISTWIDEAGEGQTKSRADLAKRCIDEAASADIIVLYCKPGEILKGALLEVGAGLANGAKIQVVGSCSSLSTVFCDHLNWSRHSSIIRAVCDL